jgi:hypothetical protein
MAAQAELNDVSNVVTELKRVNIAQLKELLVLFHSINKPLYIWGHPGVAKSAVVAWFAKSIGAVLIDIRLAMMEPVELNGLPVPVNEENYFTWLKAYWLAKIPTDRPVILFFDEFAQAMISVQNVARSITYDRKSGDFKLPDNVYPLCASNLDNDRSGTERMPSHVANTFIHYELMKDKEGFVQWAETEGGFHNHVLSWLHQAPDYLYRFDPSNKLNCTYRSWEIISEIEHRAVSDDLKELAIYGTIPKDIASAYWTFRAYANRLVPLEQVFGNPEEAPLPSDLDAQWLMTGSAAEVTTAETFAAGLKYFKRIGGDIERCYVERCRLKHGDKIENTAEYGRWMAERINETKPY